MHFEHIPRIYHRLILTELFQNPRCWNRKRLPYRNHFLHIVPPHTHINLPLHFQSLLQNCDPLILLLHQFLKPLHNPLLLPHVPQIDYYVVRYGHFEGGEEGVFSGVERDWGGGGFGDAFEVIFITLNTVHKRNFNRIVHLIRHFANNPCHLTFIDRAVFWVRPDKIHTGNQTLTFLLTGVFYHFYGNGLGHWLAKSGRKNLFFWAFLVLVATEFSHPFGDLDVCVFWK